MPLSARYLLLGCLFSCGPRPSYHQVLETYEDRSAVRLFSRHSNSPQELPHAWNNRTANDISATVNDLTQELQFPILAADLKPKADPTRLQQYHRGLIVEGADLVFMFDKEHRLSAVSSGLVDPRSLPENPEITAAQADAIAKNLLATAAEVDLQNPRLLYCQARPQVFTLCWRLDVTVENSKALSVEVIAAGENRGTPRFTSGAETLAPIKIYNAQFIPAIPTKEMRGIVVLKDGEKTPEAKLVPKLVTSGARDMNDHLGRVLSFYQDEYGRNSYDGHGATVHAAVEMGRLKFLDLFGLGQNAVWMEGADLLVFGAGDNEMGGFTKALDVIGHEFTHAVVSHTSQLAYLAESGALNEHAADVMGEMIQQKFEPQTQKFLIGENLFKGEHAGKPLRHMLQPELGFLPQPRHRRETPSEFGADCIPSRTNDNCGVHTLSGIPNKLAAHFIAGGDAPKTTALFYRVITSRLRSGSDFKDYAQQLLDECMATLDHSECTRLAALIDQVGLLTTP